jgi:hypothetical protein
MRRRRGEALFVIKKSRGDCKLDLRTRVSFNFNSGSKGNIYCLLELNMLCDCVTRGCGDHSPLTTAAIFVPREIHFIFQKV